MSVLDFSRDESLERIVAALCNPVMQYYPKMVGVPDVKIPIKFFGHLHIEMRQKADGTPDAFYMLARDYGWAVALVLTKEGKVLLNIQPKPGALAAGIEMPAGGIGKDPKRTKEDIVKLTEGEVLRETGFAGTAQYGGFCLIESGKMFDPAVEAVFNEQRVPTEPGVGRGLKAHFVFITDAEQVAEPQPRSTEKIKPILVSVGQLRELVKNNLIVETSALNCILRAMLAGVILVKA
jgi:hypothetical protein